MSQETKKCKYCKSEIPADAKVCPQCRKKLKGGKLKWILLVIVIICIAGAAAGGGSDSSSSSSGSSNSSSEAKQTEAKIGRAHV